MINFHKTPARIITNHLAITGIIVEAEKDSVLMIGVYNDMHNGDCQCIDIEVPFEKMYDLMTEVKTEDDADVLLKPLTEYLANPGDEEYKEFVAEMGVSFYDHIFCLKLIVVVDDDGNVCEEFDKRYSLEYYIPTDMFAFLELQHPIEENELTEYYNKVLAMRYQVYKWCIKQKIQKPLALNISDLEDPLLFQMSRRTFDEMERKWKEELKFRKENGME